jgi:hypothetical protein
MAQRRLAYPGTMLQAQNLITRKQDVFSGALNSDLPATELSADELADLYNQVAFPKLSKSRTGSKLLDSIGLPFISDYDTFATSYTFHCAKIGTTVYVYSDVNRTYADLVVGNYLKWADGSRDQITSLTYDSSGGYATFETPVSEDKASSTAVYQQGQVWGASWNKLTDKIIVHIDSRLFFTTIAFSEYYEIVPVGDVDVLAESKSTFAYDEDQVIVFNANGIFRIILDADSGYYFKINAGQPTKRIYEDLMLEKLEYVRNRIYSMSRIIGPGVLYGGRATAGCVIQQESAPVLPVNRKDASLGYSDLPIGPGGIFYEELSSGAGLETDIVVWQGYDNHGFNIEINDLGAFDIVRDFSACKDMAEVAAEIAIGLRVYYPTADCFFRNDETNGAQLVIHGGKTNGTTVGYASAPVGTAGDISAAMAMTGPPTAVGILVTKAADAPQMVYGFNTPSQKWTHYSVYEAKNSGAAGIALGNLQDFLVWAKDIPVIKAFTASRDAAFELTVDSGETVLKKEDEGSFLVWADDETADKIEALVGTVDVAVPLESAVASLHDFGFDTGTYPAPITPKNGIPCAIGAKKISRAYQTGGRVFLDAATYFGAQNLFASEDVGKIVFLEDGSVRHITAVYANGTEADVHESDASYDFGSGTGTPSYQAVAWDPVMPKMIKIDKLTGGGGGSWSNKVQVIRKEGDLFATGDHLKSVYLLHRGVLYGMKVDFDNSLGIRITNPSDPLYPIAADGSSAYLEINYPQLADGAEVGELADAWLIIADTIPARFLNDHTTDDDLAAVEDDPAFVLQTRFYRPLPDSAVGAICGDFMAVAEDGRVSYSAMPTVRKYIGGFYHSTWQVDTSVKDSITKLKAYGNSMVAFGRRSTWGSNYASFTTIKQPDIGEDIFTVPIFTTIDQVGLIHVDSLQDISIGQSVMICSDAGVRLFDGRQFSKIDFAQDKIYKKLRLWHHRVMSSYDLVGGYLIYGSPNVSSDSKNYINGVEGECYRLSVLSAQGAGWARFGGAQMVWPMPNTCGLNVDDANGMPIQIVLDELTGAWHQINTYNGPAGSGLVESKVDKDDAEIVNSFKAMIHNGESSSVMLEHMESHLNVDPDVQGAAFRAAFAITARIYVDLGTTYFARTLKTPVNGDVVFDRKVNSRDIQVEFEFASAGIVVTNLETKYVSRDTAGATAMDSRPTSESNYQQEYGDPS